MQVRGAPDYARKEENDRQRKEETNSTQKSIVPHDSAEEQATASGYSHGEIRHQSARRVVADDFHFERIVSTGRADAP